MIEFASIVFISCCIFQILFISLFLLRLKPNSSQVDNTFIAGPVSIVICCRNELSNLKQNLRAILNQDFPEFEVVVVDDASSDGSAEYLLQEAKKYPHLVVYTIPEKEKTSQGKKQALQLGINRAKHAKILLTDADCRPQSAKWIQAMTAQLSADRQIVLGFSPIREGKGLLAYLQRYDSFLTAVLYLNLSQAGIPYMGVGRNIAYHKSLFKEKEINMRLELTGGDDDLIVNQAASRENTAIEIRPEAETITSHKLTWLKYLRQKRRHFEPSFAYQLKHIVLLFLFSGSKVLLCLSLCYLLLSLKFQSVELLGSFLIFLAFQLYSNHKNAKVLRMKNLILLMPILDFFSVFFNSFVLMTNLFTSSKEWN